MRFAVVAFALAACTHARGTSTPTASAHWHAPDDLAFVPADTPYLMAMLEPPSEAVRAALFAAVDARVVEALDQTATVPLAERVALSPRARAVLAIMDAMRGSDPKLWWENLGFAHGGHWVLYGLSIWPVVRIDVADAGKLRGIVAHAAAAVDKVVTKQLGGVTYWQLSDGGLAIVAAVLDKEAVVALLPERAIDQLLPLVVGMRRPDRSMRDVTEVPELLQRHNFMPAMVGLVDAKRAANALSRGDGLAPVPELATPACRTELARLAATVPRVLFGYRELGAKRLDGGFVFELDPALAAKLAKLRTSLPALPTTAMLALAAAVDVDGAIELVRGWRAELAAHPFTCGPLVAFGAGLLDATKLVERALPPEAHGLRGGQLVVEDARADPPSGSGHVILAGDQIALALIRALHQLPGLATVQLGPDGRAVELPLGPLFGMLGIPPLKAFVALRAGRAAVAIGDRSEADVSAAIGAPNAAHTPILQLVWDLARFAERFPTFMKSADSAGINSFSSLLFTVDLDGDAIVMDAVGAWR